jgi:co-chaperonin GroES (HSP10)
MKPIGKYIVLKTISEEIKTNSGLLLSRNDVQDMRYRYGCVYKVGTDVSVIKEEDSVYYDNSHAFTMLIENTPYTIVSERDIVVVV